MMGKTRVIMFYLPEGGKFAQDNFKSLVLRWMSKKVADLGEI